MVVVYGDSQINVTEVELWQELAVFSDLNTVEQLPKHGVCVYILRYVNICALKRKQIDRLVLSPM